MTLVKAPLTVLQATSTCFDICPESLEISITTFLDRKYETSSNRRIRIYSIYSIYMITRSQSLTCLFRNLAKIVYESNSSVPLERVFYPVNVYVTLVEQMVEHVDRFHCWRPQLPEPEYKVDPLIEVRTYIVTFQSLKQKWTNSSTQMFVEICQAGEWYCDFDVSMHGFLH